MRKRTTPATAQLGLFPPISAKENLPRVIDPKLVPLLVQLFHQYIKGKAAAPSQPECGHE
jgi:hypothetical protein